MKDAVINLGKMTAEIDLMENVAYVIIDDYFTKVTLKQFSEDTIT